MRQQSAIEAYNQLIKSRDPNSVIEDLNAKLIRQMFIEDERDEDAYSSESDSKIKHLIEYASDDEAQAKRRRKKTRDEDVREEDLADIDDGDDDVDMDDLSNESLSVGSEEKRRLKELQKLRKGRKVQLGDGADIGNEENDEDTVYIDNLPSDEFEIRKEIMKATLYKAEFERLFF